MTRNVYLKMMSLEDAREQVRSQFGAGCLKAVDTLATTAAVGRVLAAPVFARASSPGFHAAAMDGIAVAAADTFGAREGRPVELKVPDQAVYVNTGHVMPAGTNAVVMIEQVNALDDTRVQIENPVFPWQHVRKAGEDIVASELIFPRHHRITPYCVGALLAAGIYTVDVLARPLVVIIPTGSELVDWQHRPDDARLPGRVPETNSFVLGGLVEACGGQWRRHAIVPDDEERLAEAISAVRETHPAVILTVGGSSAGSEDYTRRVFARLGEVLVHGVTMMPGKPLLVASLDGLPSFGIPGYPVSAIMAFEQFVGPLLMRLQGQTEMERTRMKVTPSRKIASKPGVEEFLRVKLGRVGQRVVATPLPRGAGCITSLTEADGIVRIPANVEGLNENDAVDAELLRPMARIHNTVVAVGSHDNTLDVLADQLRAQGHHVTLSSSHVGSMGGLRALRRGMCHVAGCHLLDTCDGSYNRSTVRRHLPDLPVVLVHLVERAQGLIVRHGNPLGLDGIQDLARRGVTFVNRQAGSGTRILLDYHLAVRGVPADTIQGYTDEEYTHMAVAMAVLSGRADVGMGIKAAAKALELDFIPVATEQYDLVIPKAFLDLFPLKVLLATIRSDAFKTQVGRLGGYDTRRTGTVTGLWEGEPEQLPNGGLASRGQGRCSSTGDAHQS